MKKIIGFLFFVIVIACISIFTCIKLGYIKQEDLANKFDDISAKTKYHKEDVTKKVEQKIEDTKLEIQTQLEQQKKKQPRDVKIIATIGKNGWKSIPSYCESGAQIFRINGSHIKNSQQMKETLENANQYINDEKCKNADLMYDTQGPEIRVLINENKINKKIKNKKNQTKRNKKNNITTEPAYIISKDDIIIIHTNLQDKEITFIKDNARNNKPKVVHIGVNYKEFINDIKKDMIITIENRTIYAKVDEIDNKNGTAKLIITEVNTKDGNYKLTDRRHINLIGKPVSQETLTENDKKYIKMSFLSGVKYYAISFVRDKKDIQEVKNIIKQALLEQNSKLLEEELEKKLKEIKIIAKIETQQGMDNLEEILSLADGIMIARGDLGSEIPMEEVPYATSRIMMLCNKNEKFSILATDVLLGLLQQDMASRNDVYVIASSLNMGINSIMLSNETSVDDVKGNKAIKELKKHIDYYNKRKLNQNYY